MGRTVLVGYGSGWPRARLALALALVIGLKLGLLALALSLGLLLLLIIIIIQHLYSAIVSYAGCRGDRKGIELVKTGHSIALVFF